MIFVSSSQVGLVLQLQFFEIGAADVHHPAAGFPGRGRPASLLRRLSRAGIGSLPHVELQTAESDPDEPE